MNNLTHKRCTICKEELPRESFHRAGAGRQGACKSCVVKRVAEWRLAHPNARKEEYKRAAASGATTRWRENLTPEERSAYYKRADLRKSFGITLETYQAMLDSQGGCCAICKRTAVDKKGRKLAVDHNHTTGRVRGLLCARCNFALSALESDPDWWMKAIDYLARFIEQTVKV